MEKSKTTVKVRPRQTYVRKRNRLQLPKNLKQICRLCEDYNMLLNGEIMIECRNCRTSISRGEQQCGAIGTDGSLIGKMVEVFDENTNNWYIRRISSFNDAEEGINAKSYDIELQSSRTILKGMTFPDENIRFARHDLLLLFLKYFLIMY